MEKETDQLNQNCPFYARYLFQQNGVDRPGPFMLVAENSNRCGLVTPDAAPCMLQVDDQPIDWRTCPRMQSVRVG